MLATPPDRRTLTTFIEDVAPKVRERVERAKGLLFPGTDDLERSGPMTPATDHLGRSKEDNTVSTTHAPDRFTTLPDDQTLEATVVALEEHGFSVDVVDDLDAAREAVLA